MARNLRAALGILRRRPDLRHIAGHLWDDRSTAQWHLVWTPTESFSSSEVMADA